MNIKDKLSLNKLKKKYSNLSEEEFFDIVNKYNSLLLFLLENKIIDDEGYKNRWNFVLKSPESIERHWNDYLNSELFRRINQLSQRNIYHLIPLQHLYLSTHQKEDVLRRMDRIYNIYNALDFDFFIKDYVDNNLWNLTNIIDNNYQDLVNSIEITNNYKAIFASYLQILNRYSYYSYDDEDELFDWFINISYLYFIINKKVDNVDEVLSFLKYVYEHINKIIEKLKLYGMKSNMDVYTVIDKYFNQNEYNKKLIK